MLYVLRKFVLNVMLYLLNVVLQMCYKNQLKLMTQRLMVCFYTRK